MSRNWCFSVFFGGAALLIAFLLVRKNDTYCHYIGWMPMVECKSTELKTLETAVVDPTSPEAKQIESLIDQLLVKKLDKNGDGVFTVEDLPVRPCECDDGLPGLHCWDQNNDRECLGDDDCDKSGGCDQSDCLCQLRKKLAAAYKSKPKVVPPPEPPADVVDLDEDEPPARVIDMDDTPFVPPPTETELEIRDHLIVPPSFESETDIKATGTGFKIVVESATEVRQ